MGKIQFNLNKEKNSNKLHLDKYYTDKKLAKNLIDITFSVIGKENITEVIEPSAGNGSFSNQIDNCIAYDIEPEGENIIKQDFLKLDMEYKKGRLFIGNPPFGDRLNLARKFMKKHYKQGDYIAYILPISQLKNNYNFYEFDLVYSEVLDNVRFSDRKIDCCFNIYKRPDNGKLNRRKDLYKLPDWIRIEEKRINSNPSGASNYTGTPDIRLCSWGCKSGEVLKEGDEYAKELGIFIDDNKYKDKLIEFLVDLKYSDFEWSSKPQLHNITIWRLKQHIINNFISKLD